MQYNITNYGNNIDGCNATTNALDAKDANLKAIIGYVLPDVFGVNELNRNSLLADRILVRALNQNGRTYYARARGSNLAGSDIVNMLYYNSTKLALLEEKTIRAAVRDVNLFRLYLIPVAAGADTTFLNIIIHHLKAGNTSADAATRALMTSNEVAYIAAEPAGRDYIIMGDFNTYRASEAAYQNLVTTGPFSDPINRSGTWTANSAFADVHTQSPRVTSNGCLAGGGMDDRFDQILVTSGILPQTSVTNKVKFIPGSYKAIGNDGNHFNGNVNDQPNTSVPVSIAENLFNMSDHLPIEASFNLLQPLAIFKYSSNTLAASVYASGDQIYLKSSGPNQVLSLQLYALSGQLISSQKIGSGGSQSVAWPTGQHGILIARLGNSAGQFSTQKLVKVK